MSNESPLKVWLERGGALLRLRLARPKANIVDAAMIAALRAAFAAHRGRAGLLAALLDAEGPHFSFGAKVVAIDVDPAKLAAISNYGAALTLNAREMDGKAIKTAIKKFAQDHGLAATEWFIFECSGTAAGQLTAYGLLVHGSTLCVVGFTMDKVEVRLSNLMAFDARALGNWGCPPERYPAALELVLAGKVKVKPFVETHPLDDINRVFEAVHGREISRRAVLLPAR